MCHITQMIHRSAFGERANVKLISKAMSPNRCPFLPDFHMKQAIAVLMDDPPPEPAFTRFVDFVFKSQFDWLWFWAAFLHALFIPLCTPNNNGYIGREFLRQHAVELDDLALRGRG